MPGTSHRFLSSNCAEPGVSAAALAEIAALNAANLDLLRRFWRTDRLAGAALLPYVAWTGFATVLNAEIARSN
jgi:translocator protein